MSFELDYGSCLGIQRCFSIFFCSVTFFFKKKNVGFENHVSRFLGVEVNPDLMIIND